MRSSVMATPSARATVESADLVPGPNQQRVGSEPETLRCADPARGHRRQVVECALGWQYQFAALRRVGVEIVEMRVVGRVLQVVEEGDAVLELEVVEHVGARGDCRATPESERTPFSDRSSAAPSLTSVSHRCPGSKSKPPFVAGSWHNTATRMTRMRKDCRAKLSSAAVTDRSSLPHHSAPNHLFHLFWTRSPFRMSIQLRSTERPPTTRDSFEPSWPAPRSRVRRMRHVDDGSVPPNDGPASLLPSLFSEPPPSFARSCR